MAGVTARQLGLWRRDLQIIAASDSEPTEGQSGWGGARRPVLYAGREVALARFYAALLSVGVTAGELEKRFGAGRFRDVPGVLFPWPIQRVETNGLAVTSVSFLAFGRSLKSAHIVSVEALTSDDGIGRFRATRVDLAGMSSEELGTILVEIGKKLLRVGGRKEMALLLKATVVAIGRVIEAGTAKPSPGGHQPAETKVIPRQPGKSRRQ